MVRSLKKTVEFFTRYQFLFPVLTAVLLFAAFVLPVLSWLTAVALIPLFTYQYRIKSNARSLVVGTFWAGFLFSLLLTSCVATMNPGGWTNISPLYERVIVIFVWLSVTCALSLGYLMIGIGTALLKPFDSMLRALTILPSLWVIGTLLSSLSFSVLLWAPHVNTLLPYETIGNIGYPTALLPAIGLTARLWGLSGMVFVAVLLNCCIWLALLERRVLLAVVPIGALCLLGLLTHVLFSGSHTTALAVGSTEFGPTQSVNPNFAKQNAGKQLDLFVLPEYSGIKDNDTNLQNTIGNALLNSKGVMVYGTQGNSEHNNNLHSNAVLTVSRDNQISVKHSKHVLIPIGEYIPQVLSYSLHYAGLQKYLDLYAKDKLVDQGSAKPELTTINDQKLAVLVCYEAIDPEQYRHLTAAGAEMLVNVGSLNFTNSRIVRSTLYEMFHFNAIANQRPMVTSTRNMQSLAFDSNGTPVAPITSNLLSVRHLSPVMGTNPYIRFGEYMYWVSGAILVFYTLISVKTRRRPS